MNLKRPRGLKQIIETFGDPLKFTNNDGILSPDWERLHIIRIVLPEVIPYADTLIRRVACHVKIEKEVKQVFNEIYEEGNWKLLKEYGGGFNPRMKRVSWKPSTHTWGIAFDINPRTNAQGTKGNMPVALIDAFERNGFYHGANFSGNSIDPMHFQYCTGY